MNKVLQEFNIDLSNNETFLIIPREELLSNAKYEKCKQYIYEMRKDKTNSLSSRKMTCLQQQPEVKQKWPLLNLVRQILAVQGYEMSPIRKSDGYKNGVKQYRRYFQIREILDEMPLSEEIEEALI
jgi:hypothetical protein